MMALRLSGVIFKRRWEPPRLQPWEGPFSNLSRRLPQEPGVAAERREEKRRYQLRRAMRASKAAKLAAERDDAVGADIAA
jgi:hypothetical protein